MSNQSAPVWRMLALCLLGATCHGVWAQEDPVNGTAGSGLQMSGYVSLAYSHDNRDGLGFRRDFTQTESVDRNSTFLPDSRVGLQASYRLSPQWEVAGQLTVKDVGDNAGARAEWAFVGWHPSAHWDVRAGRLPLDLFMGSDYQGIGYANLPIRPSTEFYGEVPAQHVDGIDLAWQWRQGENFWRGKLQLGQLSTRMKNRDLSDPAMKVSNIVNLSLTHEAAPWRLRFGHLRGVISGTSLGSALGTLQSVVDTAPIDVGTDAQRILDVVGSNRFHARYTSIGLAYDDGTWQMQSEISHIGSDVQAIPVGKRAYVLLGRRVGAFTPYLMWGNARSSRPAFGSSTDWSSVPNGNALRDQLVHFINAERQSSRTWSVGTRWDFNSQAALKLQWDQTHIDPQGYAPWAASVDQQQRSTSVNLFSVALDYVF